MKHKVIYIVLVILSISLLSCSDGPINTIRIENWASNDVSVNFKGSLTNVPAGLSPGESVELTDIMKGEYEYETIFEIPSSATAFEASESCAGTLTLNAGTKILIIYVSTFIQGNYSISASITTSDDVSEEGILPDPIGP
jgi:hypothetical protein